MRLRQVWQRLSRKEEIVERPNDWSQFQYHNTIYPNPDPRSPAGSFYMDRYLKSGNRKQKEQIFGMCREGQNVDNRSRHVYSIKFSSSYSNVLLEDDYPHLLWSLLEEYVKDGFYNEVHFERVNALNRNLFSALGVEMRGTSAILSLRDSSWRDKKDAFLSAYNQMREQAKDRGVAIVGTSEGISLLEKNRDSLK